MTVAWKERTREEQAMLNPAFIALLVDSAAEGHYAEEKRPMPFIYGFVAVSLVIHPESRSSLPRMVSTSLPVWVSQNPLVRELLSLRIQFLNPYVREGISMGLSTGLIRFDGDGVMSSGERRSFRGFSRTADFTSALESARFVGRWLARSGASSTVLALWGIRP